MHKYIILSLSIEKKHIQTQNMSSTTTTTQTPITYTDQDYNDAWTYAVNKLALSKGLIVQSAQQKIANNSKCDYTLPESLCTAPSAFSLFGFDSSGNAVPNPNNLSYYEWYAKDNKCRTGFDIFRKWCEIPKFRTDQNGNGMKGFADAPALLYNPADQSCKVTPEYCQHFEVDYNGDCKTSIAQYIFELILGTTITRELRHFGELVAEGCKIAWGVFCGSITNGMFKLKSIIMAGAEAVREWIGNSANAVMYVAKETYYKASEGICVATRFAGDQVHTAVRTLTAGVDTAVGGLTYASGQVISGAGVAVTAVSNLGNTIANGTTGVANTIGHGTVNAANTVADGGRNLVNDIGGLFCDMSLKQDIVCIKKNYFHPNVHLYMFRYRYDIAKECIPELRSFQESSFFLNCMAQEVQAWNSDCVFVDEKSDYLMVKSDFCGEKSLFFSDLNTSHSLANQFLSVVTSSLKSQLISKSSHPTSNLEQQALLFQLSKHNYIDPSDFLACPI
jgi:hypothetical protein